MKPGMNLVSYFGQSKHTDAQIPLNFDAAGDIRWYLDLSAHPSLSNLFYDVGIEWLANGNLYFGDGRTGQIVEMDMLARIAHQDLESPGLEVFVGNGSQSGNANADPRFLKRLVGGSKRCFGHASSGKLSVCSPTRASWIHVSSNHKVESINLWNRSGQKVSMEVRQPWWRAQRHASC